MTLQTVEGQAAAAREQAAAARAQAANAAREAAMAAREQVRAQAQMLRDQAEMARDMERMRREAMPGVQFVQRGPTPQQEKMIFAGFLVAVMAAVVIFYPLMRAFARRLERGGRRGAGEVDVASAERLARIEQAVDAMAIEIERISEGQRFTTKLLAARANTPVSLEH